MQKKQYWNVKTLVFMALLIAMHLVLTRVLVIDLGAYRISVGSVCTILAGLWLGPVAENCSYHDRYADTNCLSCFLSICK